MGSRRILTAAAAVLLTFVAGCVDAIGFLRLGGIYVANMSGNSIAIGMHSVIGPRAALEERLLAVAGYVAGLLITRIGANVADRVRFKRVAAVALLFEILCLALFVRASGITAGIVAGAVAMGIQAAAISRFNGVTIYTAFVTGSLVRFAEYVAEVCVGFPQKTGARRRAAFDACWFGCIWLAYVGGAIAGVTAFTRFGAGVVLWACVVLAVIAAVDFFRPAIFGGTG
jgi:uncharacterized membrane protein YoaK (UPF0700 family)